MAGGYEYVDNIKESQLAPVFENEVCVTDGGNTCNSGKRAEYQIVSLCVTRDTRCVFVLRLLGAVTMYEADEMGSFASSKPAQVYQVEAVDVNGMREFGATGMCSSLHFDIFSQNFKDRYLFLAIQTAAPYGDDVTGVARILRLDVSAGRATKGLVRVKTTIIYERTDPDILANAHNLHAGVAFDFTTENDNTYEGLIMPFGDLFKASTYCEHKEHDYGKLLLMDYDGNSFSKSVFDTGYENNMHLAYGNRNMYQLARVENDPLRRFTWSENGNSIMRTCFMTLATPRQRYHLGWTKAVDTTRWRTIVDPVTGKAAVLYTGYDSAGVWTTVLDGMPSYVPQPLENSAYVLVSYMASKNSRETRSKRINLHAIQNFSAQPSMELVETVVERSPTQKAASAPMAVVLTSNGFVFGDVFTGNLYEAVITGRLARNADLIAMDSETSTCADCWTCADYDMTNALLCTTGIAVLAGVTSLVLVAAYATKVPRWSYLLCMALALSLMVAVLGMVGWSHQTVQLNQHYIRKFLGL